MFTNFDVDISSILGTEPIPDINQQQMFNSLMISYPLNPDQKIFNDDGETSDDDFVEKNVQ
jgi:hypothetical protein